MLVKAQKSRGIVYKKGQPTKIGVNETRVKITGWNGTGSFSFVVPGPISNAAIFRKAARYVGLDLEEFDGMTPPIS